MKRITNWCCRLTVAALLLGIGVFSPVGVWAATVPCQCRLAIYTGDNAGKQVFSPIISDLIYVDPNSGSADMKVCQEACIKDIAAKADFKDKNALCQLIKKAGKHRLAVYAAYTGKDFYAATKEDYVTCTAPGTACVCPSNGWYSLDKDLANIKCKKQAGEITYMPLPAEGTKIGDWGYTSGKLIFVAGTSANGGAPICKTTQSWSGKLSQ